MSIAKTFEEKLEAAPKIRLFIGVTTLSEAGREQEADVYILSKIDIIYMAFPDKLTPCGKVRLKPDMSFTDAQGQRYEGLVLVPADKREAIQGGCSMQNGRLTAETLAAQREQYIQRSPLLRPVL